MVSPRGQRWGSPVVETNAQSLLEVLRAIPGPRHLCLEDGPLAGLLSEVRAPHGEEMVGAAVRERRGPKRAQQEALGRAEEWRIGAGTRKGYQERGQFAALGQRAKAHWLVVGDSVRVMSRLKRLLRSRGVQGSGPAGYCAAGRAAWSARLPAAARPAAVLLSLALEALTPRRKRAEQELLPEARKHRAYRIVTSCPGMGPIRTAARLPIVVTPYRFANQRGFWSYCGLGIVMRSSSDWVRTRRGEWMTAPVQQTRGLSRTFNRVLQHLFKGAATTGINRGEQDEPLYRHDVQRLDGGTKPTVARVPIAQQLASIVLSLWRNEEEDDPKKLEGMAVPTGA